VSPKLGSIGILHIGVDKGLEFDTATMKEAEAFAVR
jgi:hypothetical protein